MDEFILLCCYDLFLFQLNKINSIQDSIWDIQNVEMTFSLFSFAVCVFFFVQLSFPHKYTTFNNEDKKRTQDAMKNEIEFESYFIF